MGALPLRIVLARPGWFLNDVRTILRLDGAVIYDGGFLAGFDLTVPAAIGPHVLETEISLGFVSRKRRYELTLAPADPYRPDPITVTLKYSRLWGNFTSKLAIEPR